MSYQILSRKYRPQRFDELFGQEHVVQLLGNAVRTGRIGQAYLFVGPRGVGKTTTARILARALNCEQRPSTPREQGRDEDPADVDASFEPCGTCASCHDIAAGSDLDVVEMDAASNNHVDDVRALREQVGYATVRSRYRIWIVDEVHMLSMAAFNAFLKTLEEPPPGVKFFFCTTELHKLPETIRSRCIKVELRSVRPDAIIDRLNWLIAREGMEVEDALPGAIAASAQGGLRDAEALLEQLLAACPDGTLRVESLDRLCGRASNVHVDALLRAIAERDPGGALDAVDASLASGAKPGVLIEQWLNRFRDEMIAGARAATPQVAAPARAIDLLLQKRAHVRAGADGVLVAQVAAVELARLPDARDVDALLDAVRNDSPPAARHGRAPRTGSAARSSGESTSDQATSDESTSGQATDDASDGDGATAPAPGRPSGREGSGGEGSGGEGSGGKGSGGKGSGGKGSGGKGPGGRGSDRSSSGREGPGRKGSGPPAGGRPASRPTPAIPTGGTADAAAVRAKWTDLIVDVRGRDPDVAKLLERTEVEEVRGDQVVLSVEERAHHARTTLVRGEVQLLFGQATRRVLGVLLRPVLSSSAGRESDPQPMDLRLRDHPAVQHVTEVTGGRLITIRHQRAHTAKGSGPDASRDAEPPA